MGEAFVDSGKLPAVPAMAGHAFTGFSFGKASNHAARHDLVLLLVTTHGRTSPCLV